MPDLKSILIVFQIDSKEVKNFWKQGVCWESVLD